MISEFEQSSGDTEHWLNGFLQIQSQEARKSVMEERSRWYNTNDENPYGESELSGIFNFNDIESNRQIDEEVLSFKDLDLCVQQQERATTNGGLLIHGGERRLSPDASRSQDDHDTTFQSREDLSSSLLANEQKLTASDNISINGEELRVDHGDGHEMRFAEQVPSESGEAVLDFETELVEVTSMGIIHSKQQLLKAINEFNTKVVAKERVNFMQAMMQIEETVNEVLEEVERLDSSFKLQRMSPDSYYELKSRNELDVLVVLENVSPKEFVIEDMKTPTGYARIRVTSSGMTSLSNMASSSSMTSALNMAPSEEMLHWCTETQWGEIFFSPKMLCKKFAALVSRAAGKLLKHGSSTQRKRVSFSDRETTVPFIVNLIPTVACPQTWPLCAYWLRNYTKKWPAPRVKDDVIHGGMHLVALATSKETDPLWQISFCSARRRLLQSDCEGKKKCLRVLKVLLDKDLSRPKGIIPLYLENIVLWASRKHWQQEQWAECMLADRFLEMLVALLKCLENNDCYHFFVPTMNLFNDMKPDVAKVLAAKVKDILRNPFKYLKT